MAAVTVALLAVVVVWLAVVTFAMVAQSRDLKMLYVSVKHMAGASKHVGGPGGMGRRRTDFRVPVNLSGFLRVREHARPCRILDLSKSGAQVMPEGGGGNFPVDEKGVLTIEFGDFAQASTHVRIARFIEQAGTFGVEFVDQPAAFRDKCASTIRREFRNRLARA